MKKLFWQGLEILRILAAGHVRHRDVLPRNMMVRRPGSQDFQFVLIDFCRATVNGVEVEEVEEAEYVTQARCAPPPFPPPPPTPSPPLPTTILPTRNGGLGVGGIRGSWVGVGVEALVKVLRIAA